MSAICVIKDYQAIIQYCDINETVFVKTGKKFTFQYQLKLQRIRRKNSKSILKVRKKMKKSVDDSENETGDVALWEKFIMLCDKDFFQWLEEQA